MRLKLLENTENEKIYDIFHHNIPCYVTSEVSLKRFNFALFDDGLNKLWNWRILFLHSNSSELHTVDPGKWVGVQLQIIWDCLQRIAKSPVFKSTSSNHVVKHQGPFKHPTYPPCNPNTLGVQSSNLDVKGDTRGSYKWKYEWKWRRLTLGYSMLTVLLEPVG